MSLFNIYFFYPPSSRIASCVRTAGTVMWRLHMTRPCYVALRQDLIWVVYPDWFGEHMWRNISQWIKLLKNQNFSHVLWSWLEYQTLQQIDWIKKLIPPSSGSPLYLQIPSVSLKYTFLWNLIMSKCCGNFNTKQIKFRNLIMCKFWYYADIVCFCLG